VIAIGSVKMPGDETLAVEPSAVAKTHTAPCPPNAPRSGRRLESVSTAAMAVVDRA